MPNDTPASLTLGNGHYTGANFSAQHGYDHTGSIPAIGAVGTPTKPPIATPTPVAGTPTKPPIATPR